MDRLVRGEGVEEGEAGGVNEDKCTVWCLCRSLLCVCACTSTYFLGFCFSASRQVLTCPRLSVCSHMSAV